MTAVPAFAESADFRADVVQENATARDAALELRRHRNTFVAEVRAGAPDPALAQTTAEAMLQVLKQQFPGRDGPRLMLLAPVRAVTP